YYTYADNRGKFFPLHVDQVWEVLDMIKQGQQPGSLEDIQAMAPPPLEVEEEEPDFENVENVLELPIEKRKKKKKRSKSRDRSQTAAAAVEKAAQDDSRKPRQQNRPDKRDDRHRRPDQQGRPDRRPPQGKTGPPPASDQNRTPRPPAGKPEDSTGEKPGSDQNKNRDRDKRNFKGKGPRK
ncbi:MAG: hypothetical protein KA165_19530, partial [Saprospiraceae bacterium]|nr:hypothetical protein [Saprospiraceae bacterium]